MNKLFLTLIVLVCFVYTLPFFHPGYFPTHDGGWAVVRLTEMVRELKDFQIPPRWSDYLNHGYGYPLFQFAYPFPFYLGAVFKLIGIGYVDSIKLLFMLSVFLSGVSMYILGRKLTNPYGGLISSIFYVIAPYRLSNLYIRGSIGESLSLVFYPLIFYFTIRLYEKKTALHRIALAVLFGVLILTHNVSSLLFLPFFLGFLLLYGYGKKKNIKGIMTLFLPSIFLGFGISTYFFIPALLEKRFILLSQIKLANLSSNFVTWKDYLGLQKEIGKPVFNLGIFQISATVLSLVIFFLQKERGKRLLAWFFLSSILLILFLSHTASTSLWNFVPLSWVDFPWRFSNVLIFLTSLSCAFLGEKKLLRWIGITAVLISVLLNTSYATVTGYEQKDDLYYLTNDATTTSADEFMPIWVFKKPQFRYFEKVYSYDPTTTYSDVWFKSNTIHFNVQTQKETTTHINTIYFPGWEFYVNGKKIDIDYANKEGIITFRLAPGTYKVVGKMTETPVRIFSNSVTFVSLGAMFLYLLKRIKIYRDLK